MEAMEAVKAAAGAAGIPLACIGRSLGKRDNYVSAYVSNGRVPSCHVAAAMLAPCGYVLAAVPCDQLRTGALVIDAPPPPRA